MTAGKPAFKFRLNSYVQWLLLLSGITLKTVTENEKRKMMINKELLDILACPKCKGKLKLTAKEDGLVCDKCKLLYEIRDDIPVMLIDEAKKID